MILSLAVLSIIFSVGEVHGENPIKITISNTMDDIKWDGEWSFRSEWKASSLNEIRFDEGNIILRSAHQDGFLYFLVDNLTDFTNNRMVDRAMICIDSQERSQKNPEKTDWCYVAARGSLNGHTLNGGEATKMMGHLGMVKSHPEFIGIGGTSGINDRYIKTPHAAYEFRIPIEQIGFQDSYGFYMQVIDGGIVKTYPQEFSGKYSWEIPNLTKWVSIISIDNSITTSQK